MNYEMIQRTKALCRKNLREILSNISLKDRIHQSYEVESRLLAMADWKNAKRVSVYLSMETEIQTDNIARAAIESGKECFIPICRKNTMRMLKLRDLNDLESLPINSWGIRQPLPTAGRPDAIQTGGLDLVIVPAMAFTINGDRIGHGKGYYDRFLAELKLLHSKNGKKPPLTIGLAFHQQIMDILPIDTFDVKIDRILYSPKSSIIGYD